MAPVLKEMTISENKEIQNPKVSIFPNPTTEFIKITNTTGNVSVLNLLGQVLISKPEYHGEDISLRNLSSGTYVLRSLNGSTLFVKI